MEHQNFSWEKNSNFSFTYYTLLYLPSFGGEYNHIAEPSKFKAWCAIYAKDVFNFNEFASYPKAVETLCLYKPMWKLAKFSWWNLIHALDTLSWYLCKALYLTFQIICGCRFTWQISSRIVILSIVYNYYYYYLCAMGNHKKYSNSTTQHNKNV